MEGGGGGWREGEGQRVEKFVQTHSGGVAEYLPLRRPLGNSPTV